jgi:hypothetical protein
MINVNAPQPNLPLLRKAVEWAEAEAAKTDGTGEWNQHWYSSPTATGCGTAFCIGGWVVITTVPGSSVTASGSDIAIYGEWCHPGDVAQETLGLTDAERGDLFKSINTITDVRAAAERIAARAGEQL